MPLSFPFSWRQDAITDVPGVVDQVKGLYNMYKLLICQGEVSLKSMAVHGSPWHGVFSSRLVDRQIGEVKLSLAYYKYIYILNDEGSEFESKKDDTIETIIAIDGMFCYFCRTRWTHGECDLVISYAKEGRWRRLSELHL